MQSLTSLDQRRRRRFCRRCRHRCRHRRHEIDAVVFKTSN